MQTNRDQWGIASLEEQVYPLALAETVMRLPERIKNCVGFLSHAIPEAKYLGTAFLVGTRGRHGNAFVHLVTAAHVAELFDPGDWLFGMNGKRPLGKIWLKGGEVKWWYHPTEGKTVDCAVTIFASATTRDYDIEFIPDDLFITDETATKANLGIGDEISVVGLFTRFHGSDRHVPIVRTGNVAMMPSERIPISDDKEMDVYLAEGRSIGGLSGSPVFVRETLKMDVHDGKGGTKQLIGQGNIYFLGLMRGHWDIPVKSQSEQVEAVNMGISIVVPAQKIREVLYHPELVAMRKQADDRLQAEKEKGYPTMDSAHCGETFTRDDFESALRKATRKVEPTHKK